MKIVKEKISLKALKKMAKSKFGSLVKAVIDIKKEIMAIDGEMHADEEALLLSQGSKQDNLWGINLYPMNKPSDWIEFDSVINLRPSCGNRSRIVENKEIREKIIKIVNQLVERN